MEKHLFNLKFAAKELERHSKKCEKQAKVQKLKCKKAIQDGNVDGARIHAENAIREKNQALNYLRMASRVDAVGSRVQTAVTTKRIAQSIGGVTKAMDQAMRSMDLEKISQIMDKFEKQFEDLDVQTNTMESTISNAMGTVSSEAATDDLMKQIADEAGLELNLELPSAGTATVSQAKESSKDDELAKRLAQLRSL